METKLDGRQGQFPASFPDTFKNFFSIMNEDEDHLGLFSNMFEDKVIPRNTKNTRRQRGGSFRSTTTNNPDISNNLNVGLSNSFRVNRCVNNYCKHVKYCCLHQRNFSQNLIDFGGYKSSNNEDECLEMPKVKTKRLPLLERSFDSESCEESDTMSTTSSTITMPGSSNISNRQQNKLPSSKCCLPRILQQQTFHKDCLRSPNISNSGSINDISSATRNENSKNTDSHLSCTTYNDLNASSMPAAVSKYSVDKLNNVQRPHNLKMQKSPVLNRRRSSSIRNVDELQSWNSSKLHCNARERLTHHLKSPAGQNSIKNKSPTKENSGALLLKQTLPGVCRSSQYISNPLASSVSATVTNPVTLVSLGSCRGAQPISKQRQRLRTSSMPGENRKPRLADIRRTAIHGTDVDLGYYRLRSFSITSHGVCNLGDSVRSRRSRSINSVTSTGTSNSGRDRNNSNASRISGDLAIDNDPIELDVEIVEDDDQPKLVPVYKIAILGSSGVGKTALTYQFTTSDYICAYDLSLDDDFGQKTVSVLLEGTETDLEIIDHPACEMSTEAFCSTYNLDLFIVVYSVVDKNSFKAAEKILHYLKDSEMLLMRGAILVGNKTDLERQREVPRHTGKRLAREIPCKFIETSSGLNHNVDELLVGAVAQVRLNPKRMNNLSDHEQQRLALHNTLKNHRRTETKKNFKQIEPSTSSSSPNLTKKNKSLPKRIINLENILKVSESEYDEDEDDGYKFGHRRKAVGQRNDMNIKTSIPQKFHQSYDNKIKQIDLTAVDSKEKPVSKLTNKTKIFLTSVLKFKRNLNSKRRKSSSCSDLFAI